MLHQFIFTYRAAGYPVPCRQQCNNSICFLLKGQHHA